MDKNTPTIPIADFDSTDLDKAYKAIQEAVQAKDDTKLNDALSSMDEALNIILSEQEDEGDGNGTPDAFDATIAKYAPTEA
ncbi:hypothetical protein [Lactococcus garvieae]|uniref:hypothetical protein n=1 Tax=Lactococcus garvieae TaxID=1363 RepID=UPI003853C4F3